jgi:hypothetical protein
MQKHLKQSMGLDFHDGMDSQVGILQVAGGDGWQSRGATRAAPAVTLGCDRAHGGTARSRMSPYQQGFGW